MFVRTAVDKIESALKEFEKRKQLEAAAEERKKTNSPAPAIFTDKEISVKPLKGEGAKVCLVVFRNRTTPSVSPQIICKRFLCTPTENGVMMFAHAVYADGAEVQHQEVHRERDARPFFPGHSYIINFIIFK